jgi:hypothetical protein
MGSFPYNNVMSNFKSFSTVKNLHVTVEALIGF